MKFKKQIFGFMDMLRFKKLVPNRREALASGSDAPLPKEYRTNQQAERLHPGYMEVELTKIRPLTDSMKEFTFRRVDSNAFPFFRAGQYVSLQAKIGDSLVSRPYSIVSSPKDALAGKLVLGIEDAGFFSACMCSQAKEGDCFHMTEPAGEFHYEALRDSRKIVCIAGGSGITPFMSMAASMLDGTEEYEMTLFYGARDRQHIAYQGELDAMAEKGLKVIYVLSDEKSAEQADGYEKGFVTRALLEKYTDVRGVTFFLCGPAAMYQFVLDELKPLELPVKAVHKDASCCQNREIAGPRTFSMTVRMRDQIFEIRAKENETLLTAMERAGLNAPNKCRAGGCGFCHSKWIKGEFVIAEDRDGRREADKKFGFIHPCVTYPAGDMEIEVPAAY